MQVMGKENKIVDLANRVAEWAEEDVDNRGVIILAGFGRKVVSASNGKDVFVSAALCDMFDREPRMYKYFLDVLKVYKRIKFRKKVQAFKDKFSIQVEICK